MKLITFSIAAVMAGLAANVAQAENPSFIIWADLWYWPTANAAKHPQPRDLKGPGPGCVTKPRHLAVSDGSAAPTKRVTVCN